MTLWAYSDFLCLQSLFLHGILSRNYFLSFNFNFTFHGFPIISFTPNSFQLGDSSRSSYYSYSPIFPCRVGTSSSLNGIVPLMDQPYGFSGIFFSWRDGKCTSIWDYRYFVAVQRFSWCCPFFIRISGWAWSVSNLFCRPVCLRCISGTYFL